MRTYQDKVDQYKKDPKAAAQIIARHLDVPLDTARSTLAGLEYPSIDEQLTPAFLGSGSDTPNSAIARAARDTALFLADIAARAVGTFVAAIAIGVPMGLAMGLSPGLAAVLDPFVHLLRPLPKIALISLAIVWFGIGEASKFFLIFISCLLSVIIGSAAAAGGVSRAPIRAVQALGARPSQVFRYVVLPDAAPEIFTGVRLAIGIGWTTLIAAEMVAANAGMGWMVINASSYLRTDIVLLGIVLLGATGYLLGLARVATQRLVVPWAGHDA